MPRPFVEIFTESMGTLAIILDYDLTQAKIDAYIKYFSGKGFSQEEILGAIEKAADTCKFFPKPAEMVELITGGKDGGQAEAVAWRTAVANMEHHGSYYSVRFPDGAIAAAIEGMGGWPELCAKDKKDITLERVPAQFVALYNNAVRLGINEHPAVVLGSVEIDNYARGLAIEDPRYTRDAITMNDIQFAPVRREALAAEQRQAIEYHETGQEGPKTESERGQAAETRRLMDQLMERMKLRSELGISLEDVIRLEKVAHIRGITVKEALARERADMAGQPANNPALEIPEPIRRQMREADDLQKELRRIGGGKTYYEPKPEPKKTPECWEGLL